MVGEVGLDCSKGYWLLLLMVSCLTLTILLFLVLAGLDVSVWRLPPVPFGCCRSPGRLMALAAADLLWGLWTVGSSEGECMPLTCWPGYSGSSGRSSECGVFKRHSSCWFVFLAAADVIGMPSDWWVLKRAVQLLCPVLLGDLQSMWSVAMHAVELLPGLQAMVSIVLLAV